MLYVSMKTQSQKTWELSGMCNREMYRCLFESLHLHFFQSAVTLLVYFNWCHGHSSRWESGHCATLSLSYGPAPCVVQRTRLPRSSYMPPFDCTDKFCQNNYKICLKYSAIVRDMLWVGTCERVLCDHQRIQGHSHSRKLLVDIRIWKCIISLKKNWPFFVDHDSCEHIKPIFEYEQRYAAGLFFKGWRFDTYFGTWSDSARNSICTEAWNMGKDMVLQV